MEGGLMLVWVRVKIIDKLFLFYWLIVINY